MPRCLSVFSETSIFGSSLSLSFYFSFSSQAVKSSTDSFTNSLSLVPRFRPFLLRRSHQNVGNIVAPPLLSIPCRFSLERRLNGGQRLRKLGRRTSMVGRNACTNSAHSEKQLLLSGNARCMAFRCRLWYDCVRCSFITNENETRTKE